MQRNRVKSLTTATLLAMALVFAVDAQNVHIDVAKRARPIPQACESIVPATIDGRVDIPALVKEAICKGDGDMIIEYTYVINSLQREIDKKGKIKEESFVYEVFIPTLKGGARTRGVVVVTSHNGISVPPAELEKERKRAAERIEKAEEKIAREYSSPPAENSNSTPGILPVGMYSHTAIKRSNFGFRSGGAALAVDDFLRTCELTLLRREQIEGRETLIFSFTPRPDAQFDDDEKYIKQLRGEVWIDAKDRIVTRLVGWPASAPDVNRVSSPPLANERPPAVYHEMMRLPQQGIWLPRVVRINGADYPTLFDGITTDSTSTYSQFIRFWTEIQDVKLGAPKRPR